MILVEELGAATLVDLDTVIIMLVLHRVTGSAIALNCGNASMTIRLGFGKPSDGLASHGSFMRISSSSRKITNSLCCVIC
jgi:hypothetical protein